MQRSVCVFTPSYDAFFSWFAAGALTRVKIKQKRAIHEAVIQEDWQTARKLLEAVMQGRYLVLPDLLPPILYGTEHFEEHNLMDSAWCLQRYDENNFFSSAESVDKVKYNVDCTQNCSDKNTVHT